MTLVRLARVALAFALVLTIVFAASLPFPPMLPHERVSFGILASLFVVESVALALLVRRRALAQALVYLLGFFGVMGMVTHLSQLARGELGNAPVWSLVLVLLLSVFLVVAAGLTLVDERRWRSARSTGTS